MNYMEKVFISIILLLGVFSCSSKKSKTGKGVAEEVCDSTATVIVHSELEASITIESNKERIILFEEKGKVGNDTVQLKLFPWDLVTVGYSWGTILKDTILVRPQDTIITSITKKSITTTLRRAGKPIATKWSDAELLPKNKEYEPIAEMYENWHNLVSPPPPAPVDAPEIIQKETRAKSDNFFSKKKDFSQVVDTLKKYSDTYFQAIEVYYNSRLKEVTKEPDSLKRNFYESYILYRKYVDMQRLQQIVRQEKIYFALKKLCQMQSNIEGAFTKSTVLLYFTYNYFSIRKSEVLFTTLYDSIIPTEFYNQEKLLKEITLQNMLWKKYPREEIITYVNKFLAQYGINEKIEELKLEIEYDLEVTNDLNLEAGDGTKTTFEELRMQHKGKVLYVDFWASWCNPCRMMLPESAKLHKEFQDVVFIYLALSDKEKEWKIACKDKELHENSYRITNSKTSTFIKKMGIKAIPYYMIYGKDGKLYQNDSPRPDTKEIRKILKDLTK